MLNVRCLAEMPILVNICSRPRKTSFKELARRPRVDKACTNGSALSPHSTTPTPTRPTRRHPHRYVVSENVGVGVVEWGRYAAIVRITLHVHCWRSSNRV